VVYWLVDPTIRKAYLILLRAAQSLAQVIGPFT